MQNQWLDQVTINAHDECLVCKEHKIFQQFKIVNPTCAFVSSGI